MSKGRRYSDDHWRAVAKVYDEAVALGEPPLPALMGAFSATRPAVGKWVMRCREKGFLPPGVWGRPAGNVPTPRNWKIRSVAAQLGVAEVDLEDAVRAVGGDIRI